MELGVAAAWRGDRERGIRRRRGRAWESCLAVPDAKGCISMCSPGPRTALQAPARGCAESPRPALSEPDGGHKGKGLLPPCLNPRVLARYLETLVAQPHSPGSAWPWGSGRVPPHHHAAGQGARLSHSARLQARLPPSRWWHRGRSQRAAVQHGGFPLIPGQAGRSM